MVTTTVAPTFHHITNMPNVRGTLMVLTGGFFGEMPSEAGSRRGGHPVWGTGNSVDGFQG